MIRRCAVIALTACMLTAQLGLTACVPQTDNGSVQGSMGSAEKEGRPKLEKHELRFGEKASVEKRLEFTVDGISWSEEIVPQGAEGVYTFIGDEPGSAYFVARGNIKNVGEDDCILGSDLLSDLSASILIGGETIDATARIETTVGYTDVLEEGENAPFIVYAPVPDDVRAGFPGATLTLSVNDRDVDGDGDAPTYSGYAAARYEIAVPAA